jgi:predicted nuclease of restriction endonuclease-like (RecB) superfamily
MVLDVRGFSSDLVNSPRVMRPSSSTRWHVGEPGAESLKNRSFTTEGTLLVDPGIRHSGRRARDRPSRKGRRMARKKPESRPPARKPKSGLSPEGYEAFLGELKERIRTAQLRASVAVNRELILLYWQTGRDILVRQQEHGWGAKVIDRLSQDLRREFPGVEGFSPRNLKYMRAFARAWTDESIVQEALAQITWYHNLALLEKIKRPDERLWYARKTVENGWSRNVLVHWIERGLYERQGKAQTNFQRTLPRPQSDLARETLKDPYKFEFLTLAEEAEEATSPV